MVPTSEESQLEELRKLKNGKTAGKAEITGEMIKGGGERVVDWIWKVCNMAFESGVASEDWRSAVIVPLYRGKGGRNKCKNYRGISFLSVVGKIYLGILGDSRQSSCHEMSYSKSEKKLKKEKNNRKFPLKL